MFSNNLTSIEGVEIFPIVALILFVLFFIVVVIKIIKMDKKVIKKMENIPLEDDDNDFTTKIELQNENK